jgi:hypothetical protein
MRVRGIPSFAQRCTVETGWAEELGDSRPTLQGLLRFFLFRHVARIVLRKYTNKRRKLYDAPMDEGRKRVLAIVVGILVARHLKTTEDLFDNRSTESEKEHGAAN